MTALLQSLESLVATLQADGYTVVGPRERDGAIVLDVIDSAAQLPSGWGVETGPGTYRLRRRADRAAFAHSAGPQAWKQFLHPPRVQLWSADRAADGAVTFHEADDPPPRYAFLGVRACDLRAIAIQDRVLGMSTTYAARRQAAFIVSVDCTEPAATCFCVPAGGGPDAQAAGVNVDLALTELAGSADTEPTYVVDAGSAAGARILAMLPQVPAPAEVVAAARDAVSRAADHMGRSLPEVDLRQMLADAMESPRWDEIASRCLTCGNCTMTCPTCFCTSVTDTTELRPPEPAGSELRPPEPAGSELRPPEPAGSDLPPPGGGHAERWQHWASCFEVDFSYLHGGSVRTSARSRYRQWLTHKLSTWHDQFGESGCVGCGRCIAWCPAGIDITAEATALAQEGADHEQHP